MPPPLKCSVITCTNKPILKRPKTGDAMCKECFFYFFEAEIHWTITTSKLFKRGDKVAIGASGGKDSTVLAHTMKLLNERYDYGLDLYLLSIDEGITGYRDDSLETVKQNRDDYGLPLKILSYKDLYGWTMDEIVAQIGKKNNCTFCGVFRRQALDRGAALIGANMIVTGHNADDMAETVLMNVMRGDMPRLSRCTNIITEGEGTIPRCKPLKFCYEKEIVLYAHYKNLVYFSTECIYAPNAYRGYAREFIKDVERARPSAILDIIYFGETMKFKENVKFPTRKFCTRCGFVASQEICKACVLLEGLNTGNPRLGITKTNKAKRAMGIKVEDGSENKGKRRKENKDPNYLSKRKMKRELRKERRGQSTCGDECASTCQSEPEVSKKENTKVSVEELIPEGTSDDLSDLILPLALYSSDEESDSTKEKKEEQPLNKNQRKSTCGEGGGSNCSTKSPRPPVTRKTCRKGCGSSRSTKSSRPPVTRKTCGSSCSTKASEPSIPIFQRVQTCGEDDFLVSFDSSSDKEPGSTKDSEKKSTDRDKSDEKPTEPLTTKKESEVIFDDGENSEAKDSGIPPEQKSSKEEEFDALERIREQEKNNDVECDCPECQGDDEIGEGFINMKLLKKLLNMEDVREEDRIRLKINGKLIDVDAALKNKAKVSVIETDEWKEAAKPRTSGAASKEPKSSLTRDTEKPETSADSSTNSEAISDGQPTIVKANPTRKGPSLLLPEMMHRTPNKLDF